MKKRDDLYLREIESRIEKVISHLKKINQTKFFKSDLHRSAVVRELEVIGEAAGRVSPEARAQLPEIPWQQMIGMRNRLIHGYFDVDYSIVWEVAKKELPKLLDVVREGILFNSPPVHSWRLCPIGFYHVRNFSRKVAISAQHLDGQAIVRQHCRRNPSGKDQLYPKEILEILETAKKYGHALGSIGKLDDPKWANNFDLEIQVWTKYWNDVLAPAEALSPNVVKALLGSESSFGRNAADVRVTKGNFARGPFQVTDQTRKILADEKGELHEHFLTLTAKDIKNPAIAVAAAIRWLFHKKELASSFLKRDASWEEAVADYKSYLRKKKPYWEQGGMITFSKYLKKLGQP